jgi:AraC-like DNA-binding protein
MQKAQSFDWAFCILGSGIRSPAPSCHHHAFAHLSIEWRPADETQGINRAAVAFSFHEPDIQGIASLTRMRIQRAGIRKRKVTLNDDVHEHVCGSGLIERDRWANAISTRYGMNCMTDPIRSVNSRVRSWFAGEVEILEIDLTCQRCSPVGETAACWPGDHLFLKLVTSGSVLIGQHGEQRAFGPGSMVLMDPARSFTDEFVERTRLIAMRIPKQAMRARGLRHSLSTLVVPDLASPDVLAVRDFLLCVVKQAGVPSPRTRERFGEQVLDLMDVILNGSAHSAHGRSSEATLLRAKRLIARRIGEPQISVAQIAAEMNISANHLNRIFKTDGVSVMRYLWLLRLEHAARLLTGASTQRLQVQQIAYQCGFTSTAHFSRTFRQRYGVSPRDAASAGLLSD